MNNIIPLSLYSNFNLANINLFSTQILNEKLYSCRQIVQSSQQERSAIIRRGELEGVLSFVLHMLTPM